jgi:hypothetical protein
MTALARRAWWLVALALACTPSRGPSIEGRWQGGSTPPADPVSIALTLRARGDSVRGWGVARTDGPSFPIVARGTAARSGDTLVVVALALSPWRSGVVDIVSAQVRGTLRRTGRLTGTLRSDGGFGPGAGTRIALERP